MRPGTIYYKLSPQFLAAAHSADLDELYRRRCYMLARLSREIGPNTCAVTAGDRRDFERLAAAIGYTGQKFVLAVAE